MVRDPGVEPSTLRLSITDGPYLRSAPSMLMPHFANGSILQDRTFHDKGRFRGQFDVNQANLPRLRHISRMVRDPGVEPSLLRLNIADGSILQDQTVHSNAPYHGWFSIQTQTFHAKGPYHGQFAVNKANPSTLKPDRADSAASQKSQKTRSNISKVTKPRTRA